MSDYNTINKKNPFLTYEEQLAIWDTRAKEIWHTYYGVPFPEYREKPVKTQKEISLVFGINQQTVSRIIKRLQKKAVKGGDK